MNTEEEMLELPISFHTFICLYLPDQMWNFLMKKWDTPKELGLSHVDLLTVSLYIPWEQFSTIQDTHHIQYNQVPLNIMLDLKILHQNLFNNVALWNLKDY